MTVSEKIKTIDNKIEQNKVQYNLDRQTTKISALLSGNISKHDLLTGKDVLSKKRILRKASIIKKSEYSPLGSKKANWHCKNTISSIRQGLWIWQKGWQNK